MRLTFYKIALVLSNGKETPITIATRDIADIEQLVENNKMLYSTKECTVTRFYVLDTLYTFAMDEDKYNEELVYCDIVNDPNF